MFVFIEEYDFGAARVVATTFQELGKRIRSTEKKDTDFKVRILKKNKNSEEKLKEF